MKHRKSYLRQSFIAEYCAWKNAYHRCHNVTHVAYPDYGARGITMADEWKSANGFAIFIDHVGPRPDPAFSLDRIDNNRGYEPGNVRWTDRTTQQNNRRRRPRIVKDYGWGVGRAPGKGGQGGGTAVSALLPHEGRIQTITEWAKELGLNGATIRQRLRRGLSPAEALDPCTSRAPRPSGPTIH